MRAYTKEDLKQQLAEMGLKNTEAVMVHSSMKSLGNVEGGADTVVDAFMEFFSEGLFMTPTHSIAAYGPNAAEYIKGEENVTTPCQPGGCWDQALDSRKRRVENMEIRKTRIEELEEVLEIYAYARQFMAEHGNPNQWKKTNPPRERVEQDIKEGKSHVCVEGDEILGVFYFAIEEDPTYRVIYDGEWKNPDKYAVVHRIASAGKAKGVGSFCMNWAYEQFPNVKIDTHRDNVVMQNMLKKNGFSYCGIIHLENGEERLAFQKE